MNDVMAGYRYRQAVRLKVMFRMQAVLALNICHMALWLGLRILDSERDTKILGQEQQ